MTTTREEIDTYIGEHVHQELWRRKITARAAGRVLGMTGATLGRKLRGLIAWSAADVLLIAGMLDVDPSVLLPRLDSNQQPSGYASAQVSGVVIDARGRFGRAA